MQSCDIYNRKRCNTYEGPFTYDIWFWRLLLTYIHIQFKDLSSVKTGFKSVPLQFYFEIPGLASAEKWREIQNLAGEERF